MPSAQYTHRPLFREIPMGYIRQPNSKALFGAKMMYEDHDLV
jgi:hypothetical protein